MKGPQKDPRGIASAAIVHSLLLVAGFSLVCAAAARAYDPAWWSWLGTGSEPAVEAQQVVTNGGVVTTNYIPNNNSIVLQGQLKRFTVRAVDELNANLTNGAGTNLNNLVAGWQQDYLTNNYATNSNPLAPYNPRDFTAMTVGQVKYIGNLVWAQLVAGGYTNAAPSWLAANAATDHRLAVLGQLKEVFNFDFNSLEDVTSTVNDDGSVTFNWALPDGGSTNPIKLYGVDGSGNLVQLAALSSTSTTGTISAATAALYPGGFGVSNSVFASLGTLATGAIGTPNSVPAPRYAVIDLGTNFFPGGITSKYVVAGNQITNAATGAYLPQVWQQGTKTTLNLTYTTGPISNAFVAGIADSTDAAGYAMVGYGFILSPYGASDPYPYPPVGLYWSSATTAPNVIGTAGTLSPFVDTRLLAISDQGFALGWDQTQYGGSLNTLSPSVQTPANGAPYWAGTALSLMGQAPPGTFGSQHITAFGAGGASSWCGFITDNTHQPQGPIINGVLDNRHPHLAPWAINDSNIAVGSDDDGAQFLRLVGNRISETRLGPGSAAALNNATNAAGQPVPQIVGINGTEAMLWDYTTPSGAIAASYIPKKLTSLIAGGPASPWHINTAVGINNLGAIVGTATYTPTPTVPPNPPDPISAGSHGVMLLPVEVTSVSFDGDKYWQLESDTTDASGNYTQYARPQWTDINGSTNTTDPGVHNYAVAYTCNATPKIGATFRVPGASNWSSLKFKATGSDGISIPATAGTVGSNGVTVTMPVTASLTALPANTVKFYNWADTTAFTLNWSISVDGGTTWAAINSTKHSIYVTLVDPNVTDWNTGAIERQLTLFDTACRQATGSSDPATIVNKVYSVFTNKVNSIPTVQRVNPSTSQPDGPALTYWGPAATQAKLCWTTPGLLSTGDARCGGWAHFFHDALLVNGISSTVEVVDPPENNPHDSPWKTGGSSLYDPAASKLQNDITNFLPDKNLNNYKLVDIIFYVKNWNLSTSTTAPFAPVKPNGVAGQGGAGGAYPSATYFNNHAIVEYGGKDYDPSYGSPIAPSRTVWENNALSGFGAVIENTTTGVQYKWIWKPENQGTQDTIFLP